MDVRRFTRADVPRCAALLAARGNAHPLAAPFDPVAEIEALLDAGATGWAAPGGYLIGKAEDGEAWVQYAGHAARDARTYRHLYAAASRDWVAAGAERHAVLMPDGDLLAEAAFGNLAFGREHVFALASLADQPTAFPDSRIPIRVGTPGDYDSLRPLFDTVARHLEGPPVFSPRPAAYYETLPDLFRADLADPDVTYLIASVDGCTAGFATWEPMPPRICVPEGTYAFSHAAVLPEFRGRGVGQALTRAGLAHARERGATVTWSDWRLTNLDAEPYWRGYGWTPYLVRMTRRVEPAR